MIPYGRQSIDDDDIAAVANVLRSDWLTQGPKVHKFEEALALKCGARYAVVTSNGTTALHAAYVAIGLGKGDEFITSPMTFPATTNAGIWQGAAPVFVDIDEQGNMDSSLVEAAISSRTKAIVPIDYTGRPADLSVLRAIADKHHLVLIEDACQALGAQYQGQLIGSVSDLTVFSFHPVKSITTGEGGAILTNNESWYRRIKRFITHGVEREQLMHPSPGAWYFEMQELGQNYRMTDMQAALGISQLQKLDAFIERRRVLAERYIARLEGITDLLLPTLDTEDIQSAWHLFVIRLTGAATLHRDEIFTRLHAAEIGVQLHHIPVYLHPYYADMGFAKGICPKAEERYREMISLPLYPDLSFADQDRVILTLKDILQSV